MKRVLSLALALIVALGTGAFLTATALETPQLPTVGFTTVKGCDFASTEGFKDFDLTGYDTDFLLGAVLTVEGTGSGYDDYIVECLLNLSVACKAKLLGKYSGRCGNYPWQGSTSYVDLPAGDIAVMAEALISMTVYEVNDEVGTFYCALALDPESISKSINIALDVVLYKEPAVGAEPDYIDPQYAQGTKALSETLSRVLPTAKVTMVDGMDFATTTGFIDFPMADYDPRYVVGAVFELADAGKSYDNYIAEFLLDISGDCDAALLGQYGTYVWQGTNNISSYISLNSGVYGIMSEALLDVRVRELESNVGTFYCAFAVDSASLSGDLNVDLDFVLYKEPTDGAAPRYITCPLTQDSVDVSAVFENSLPAVSITTINGADFAGDADYAKLTDAVTYAAEDAFGAVVTADSCGKGYDVWLPALNIFSSNSLNCTVYIYNGDVWSLLGSDYALTSTKLRLNPISGAVADMSTYKIAVVINRETLMQDTAITLGTVIYNSVNTQEKAISAEVSKGFRYREVERKVSLEWTPVTIAESAPEGVAVIVKDTQGVVIEETAPIGTGMIIEYIDEQNNKVETVAVVMGDADSTPGIAVSDLEAVLNMSVQTENDSTGDIAPVQRVAADVNGDGYVDALDAMFIDLYLSGTEGYNEVTYDKIIVNK